MIFNPTQSLISYGNNSPRKLTKPPQLQSQPQQRQTNLLDLLSMNNGNGNGNGNQDSMQTFEEFQEIVNRFDFEKNQLAAVQSNTHIVSNNTYVSDNNNTPDSARMLQARYSLNINPTLGNNNKNNNNNNNNQVSQSIQYFNHAQTNNPRRNENHFARRTGSVDFGTQFIPSVGLLGSGVGGLGTGLGSGGDGGFLNIIRQDLNSRASTKRTVIQQRQTLNNGLQLTYQLNGNPPPSNPLSSQYQQPHQNNSVHRSSAHSSRSFNGHQQINQYQLKQVLGSGGFSTVHLCRDIHTQKLYAVKIIKKQEMRRKLFRKNSNMLTDNYINNQIAIMKKIDHPYIIRMHEVIEDQIKKKIYIILDYCPNGFIGQSKNIDNLLARQSQNQSRYKKLLQSECKRYYKQLALAIDYIHNIAKIAHRDIKPENILLSDKDEVKLSDFGLGTEDIQVQSKSGTRGYLPPQARDSNLKASLTSRINTQMGDIWALGITLLVLLQGKHVEIEDAKISQFITNMKQISSQCKDFLKKCLEINPEHRIKASQVLDHPWIQAKKQMKYLEIKVSKEEQQAAIVMRTNRDILTEITRLHLPI